MGMDIKGKNPSTKRGEYIYFSVWAWSEVLSAAKYTGYNVPIQWTHTDGHGLDNQEKCDELASILEELSAQRDSEPTKGIKTKDIELGKAIREVASDPEPVLEELKKSLERADKENLSEFKLDIVTPSGMSFSMIVRSIRPRESDELPKDYLERVLKGVTLPTLGDLPLENRPVDYAHIDQFTQFLRSCGGFEIH